MTDTGERVQIIPYFECCMLSISSLYLKKKTDVFNQFLLSFCLQLSENVFIFLSLSQCDTLYSVDVIQGFCQMHIKSHLQYFWYQKCKRKISIKFISAYHVRILQGITRPLC